VDREPVTLESFGDESGLVLADTLVDRGNNSSLRLPICGVGGVELVGEALPREDGFTRVEFRQSPSSGVESPRSRPFEEPNFGPGGASSDDGLNLLPMIHVSSLSGCPGFSGAKNPEPFFLVCGISASEKRGGRVERQSSTSSDGIEGRSACGNPS